MTFSGVAGGLTLALLVGALWLSTPRAPRPLTVCGTGRADSARARRVEARLATTGRGAELLAGSPVAICFAGAGDSALVEDGTLILDEAASDAENAARLGHLLLHAREGLVLDPGSEATDCATRVQAALAAEVRAHALELELRRTLGVVSPRRRYAFEQRYWNAPAASRATLLGAALAAEPEGIIRAYAARCAGLRR